MALSAYKISGHIEKEWHRTDYVAKGKLSGQRYDGKLLWNNENRIAIFASMG